MSDNFMKKGSEYLSIFKQAVELAQKSNDLPLIQKLFEAQQQMIELQAENLSLRQKIQKYKDLLETKKNMVYEKNAYWRILEPKDGGEGRTGPYCSRCYDAEKLVVNLKRWDTSQKYNCPNCKITFNCGVLKDRQKSSIKLGRIYGNGNI